MHDNASLNKREGVFFFVCFYFLHSQLACTFISKFEVLFVWYSYTQPGLAQLI